jgi:energy-converting hydrogenase Eha subunit A
LAREGFRITVFSSRPDFIEASLVQGYLASGHAAARSIIFHSRLGKDDDFTGAEEFRECFHVQVDPSSDWEVAYYRALLAVDGLLVIGGGRSAFTAGLIAISRGVPVIALASMGGAAQRIWRRLPGDHPLVSDDDLSAMAGVWSTGSAAALVTSLRRQCDMLATQRRQAEDERRQDGRRETAGLAAGFALLLSALASIPISYAHPPGSAWALSALVGAPLLAGACGAIMRNAFDDTGRWGRTVMLGTAAGVITTLLFLAAQLTTTPDVLTTEASRRLLFFILPVAFVSGLTFDAVYNRLRAQDVSFASGLGQPPPP